MASEDPNRQEHASSTDASSASTSPAEIEAAVARLTPEAAQSAADTSAESAPRGEASDPDAKSDDAQSPPPPPAAEEAAPAPIPVPPSLAAPRRSGPSPWLALPIGALAGALASGMVAYGLIESGTLKPLPGSDMQPLLQRLSALEQRPRQDLAPSVAQLDSRVAQLEASAASVADLQKTLAATQSEVASLKQALAALTTSASQSATLAQQAAGLAGQVATLSKAVQDRAAASEGFDRALGAVVTVGALREAVAAGRPFAAELTAARGILGAQAAAFEPFVAAAAKGYPTPIQAAARLRDIARTPVEGQATSAPLSSPGSFVDRILSSAESLVKVQPADRAFRASDQRALDAAADQLAGGDTAQALATIDTLSPEAKAKVKGIVAEISARRDALQAAATLLQQALAAISGKLP
ncbi:COG4223 family protein [Aquabacter cavernae]|uniref:COG4223 family protein n=1 Tax=Aquabacter cavernae TaxID=2496029 RepID=UPI000F8EA0B1|nr:hypothetical protein [Aquabacter cavernae]